MVSFAQSEYIFNETSEREGPITVLARGNLSESNFSIPVTVTDGTATGTYDVGCFIYYYTSYHSTLLCTLYCVHGRLNTEESLACPHNDI